MQITFDPDKDAVNLKKHGLSLQFGTDILADPNVLDLPDVRWDYGEDRWIAYGRVGARIYVCVYAEYADHSRIISVRKANERETKRYQTEPR